MKIACAALWMSLAACHRHELGTGPHIVERDYARPAALVWSAAVEGVKDERLAVRSARFDGRGGALDTQDVRITVHPPRESRCRVSIRVAPEDAPLARRLHGRIAATLEAKPGEGP